MVSTSFIENILGIYLLFNGDCCPDDSYINEMYITPTNKLQCVLPNSTLSGGQWINPNEQYGNGDYPASISPYRAYGGINFNEVDSQDNNNTFKCCLPSNCSDPTTNFITVNIFSKL